MRLAVRSCMGKMGAACATSLLGIVIAIAVNGCAASSQSEEDTGASGEDALSQNTPAASDHEPTRAIECTDNDYDVCSCNLQIRFDWHGIWTADPIKPERKQQLAGELASLGSCEGGQQVNVYTPTFGSKRGWLRLTCNDGPQKGKVLGDLEMFETLKMDTRRVLTVTIKKPDGSTDTGVFTRPHSTPAARCYP